MRLVELVIARGDSVVRRIPFKSGLNLILDKPTKTATQSGNSVGKTTVLRLIDFCLGSEGDDIWEDAEFKKTDEDVYEFLHGRIPVVVTLELENERGGRHKLSRSFAKGRKAKLEIDGNACKKLSEYREEVKLLLFRAGGAKPSLRQLILKFVRSSTALMGRTLRFLGDYGSETDYEAVHLFLFGFTDVKVLEDRLRLTNVRKRLNNDLQALNRLRNEGEIEQLLLHLQREIHQIGLSPELRGEVPEIAARANSVTVTRSKAALVASNISALETEIMSLQTAIKELENEYADIDRHAIETIYREAEQFIPKLHHKWNELTDFVQNLRGRKQQFLQSQIAELQKSVDDAKDQLNALQSQERDEIGSLVKSPEFVKALEMRSDLQDKLKKLGSLEQDLQDRKNLKAQLDAVDQDLAHTREKIEQEKSALTERVSVFNQFFSRLSESLYGEQYLLHFDETNKGTTVFRLSAVGSNVGSGKKASQTAAFDLAYVKFVNASGLNFPKFVCHDGVEQIHGNQLAALLEEANKLNGQLVISTLRDKLPAIPEDFLKANTILELGQDDKLFRLPPKTSSKTRELTPAGAAS